MFDLDQTFSPNILPYKQMLGYLATSVNKAFTSRKKLLIRDHILMTLTWLFFSSNIQNTLCGLTLSSTMLDDNV